MQLLGKYIFICIFPLFSFANDRRIVVELRLFILRFSINKIISTSLWIFLIPLPLIIPIFGRDFLLELKSLLIKK